MNRVNQFNIKDAGFPKAALVNRNSVIYFDVPPINVAAKMVRQKEDIIYVNMQEPSMAIADIVFKESKTYYIEFNFSDSVSLTGNVTMDGEPYDRYFTLEAEGMSIICNAGKDGAIYKDMIPSGKYIAQFSFKDENDKIWIIRKPVDLIDSADVDFNLLTDDKIDPKKPK